MSSVYGRPTDFDVEQLGIDQEEEPFRVGHADSGGPTFESPRHDDDMSVADKEEMALNPEGLPNPPQRDKPHPQKVMDLDDDDDYRNIKKIGIVIGIVFISLISFATYRGLQPRKPKGGDAGFGAGFVDFGDENNYFFNGTYDFDTNFTFNDNYTDDDFDSWDGRDSRSGSWFGNNSNNSFFLGVDGHRGSVSNGDDDDVPSTTRAAVTASNTTKRNITGSPPVSNTVGSTVGNTVGSTVGNTTANATGNKSQVPRHRLRAVETADEALQRPRACRRVRRLKMPPEEALDSIFADLWQQDRARFGNVSLSTLVPKGIKVVVVMDSLATLEGKYAKARELHRKTWMTRAGTCSPRRHEEADCVLFPIFPMNAGGPRPGRGDCPVTQEEWEEAERVVRKDNEVDPDRSESFLLRWEEPYVNPWWTPRPLWNDIPRHLLMVKSALVRYPWMTHFLKQDLDCFPWYPWVLPAVAAPAEQAGKETGMVYFGQWKQMGTKRRANKDGVGGCGVPQGKGGWKAEACPKSIGVKNATWNGNFVTVNYTTAVQGWCNDWSMKDKQPNCSQPEGICSGFMFGHVWSYTRPLASAIADSKDMFFDKYIPQDYAHSDIRAGAWVYHVAMEMGKGLELRAGCGDLPWRHFG